MSQTAGKVRDFVEVSQTAGKVRDFVEVSQTAGKVRDFVEVRKTAWKILFNYDYIPTRTSSIHERMLVCLSSSWVLSMLFSDYQRTAQEQHTQTQAQELNNN
jgi:hypothetical protein